MYGVALLTSTLLTIAGARIYERCELARDLLKLGVRREHIATWVCIAYHESRFDTAARNPSSGDHGLLQISQIYWCGAGKACGLPCSALRDDDISDDVECAQTIYEEHTRLQGNGFLAWVVYPNYCKHNPKKYLADCNLSVRDGYSLEERGRSSQVHGPYPALNSTLSNSVQRVSYPQSDQSLPGYLAIAALVRGKFESDFERNYNNRHKVLQSQSRVSNIDNGYYDFLASFATRRSKPSTTTTSTMQPEPYYKPVKPWRVIETNQFRRRMMNLDIAKSENMKELTKFINTFVSTTPTSSINKFTSTKITNTLSPSASILNGTFEKTVTFSNKTCCNSDGVTAYLPNQQKYNTHVSFNTQSPVMNTSPTKIKTSTTNPTPFWNAYNKAWTTPAPYLTRITSTKKPTEASLVNSNIKPLVHQYGPTTFSPLWTTTNKPLTTTVKQDTHQFDLSHSIGTGSAPKEKGVFINTSPVVKVTTLKPAISTQGSAKEWTVRQPGYQVYNDQNKANQLNNKGNQFKTETPQTAWRRGKSWSTAFQEVPLVGVESSTPRNSLSSPLQFNNQGNLSESVKHSEGGSLVSTQPTPVYNSVSTAFSNAMVDSRTNQITTLLGVERSTPRYSVSSNLQFYNQGNLSESVKGSKGVSVVSTQATPVSNSVSTAFSNAMVDSRTKQLTTLLEVERSTPRNLVSSNLQFNNQGNLSESVKHSKGVSLVSAQPTPVSNSVSIAFSNAMVDSRIKQITTEKPTTTTSSPKTTLSIFDLYLNPTKRTQLPNYRFLFSNNSANNFKIFSGGTTSSPIIKN